MTFFQNYLDQPEIYSRIQIFENFIFLEYCWAV